MSRFRSTGLWVVSFLTVFLSPLLLAQTERVGPSGKDEASETDHPAERERWFLQGRVAPLGKTPAQLRWRAYQQKIQMRAARIVAARQATSPLATESAPLAPLVSLSSGWVALGPAPLVSDPGTGQNYGFTSGRATTVLIDPADATGNTVYLGGAYGGLWRTTNGLSGGSGNPSGVTWTPLIDTMATLAVGAIAVQPGNATSGLSNTILVGTGEANSSADSYYGLGILRSTNHGQTWNLIAQDSTGTRPFHGLAFSKMAFSTANTSLVLAATATSSLGVLDGARVSDNRGVYISTDAGATWAYETSVKDGAAQISPVSNSVTSVVYNSSANKFFAAFRYHGFYSSTDGANWTRLATQPAGAGVGLNKASTCPSTVPNSPNPPACPLYRGEIAVVSGRNEMYVWYTDSNDTDQGIWQSLNGGSSWTRIVDTSITNCGTQDSDGGCGTVQGGYDLELAAVAHGAETQLFAGARNIYKCVITASAPTCSGSTEPNFFMNLTHVYGCLDIAKVHPDQHGLDAMLVNNTEVMYFANDGGVYRALDGFLGLNTGVCGSTNQFDSLNGTLGSMTEFVSMSQDPANSAIILGGTQDNGSPSTSQTNASWHSVLGGDGGYNEINPNSPSQWFTSNPPFTQNNVPFNINIYSCSHGSSCLDGNFINTTQNATIGGDIAPFYPFFILDPKNPAKMIIGTSCRVWRGDVSSGVASGFVALTDSFETPGAVSCTGNEVNQVHAIDAGGASDSNGSKVMYAVTEGTGPRSVGPGGVPTGGEVWASINASGGIGTWSNVTSTINPNHYSIGAVAVDSSDATGSTAYVGIEGFNASHVFKTVNHGGSWTDFSGTLPDAPVNSLVVDGAAGVVYVGTDVGVFSSPTNSVIWSEVGPAPAPGVAGYLPDAPVTRLRLFSNNGTKILRASTYGRGIWQFQLAVGAADFTVSVPTTTLTTYPNQTTPVFAGTLTSVNGYASPVNLSCLGVTPFICSAAITPVTPTSGGTSFTINVAHGTTSDFNFKIHAAGTDSVPQLHDTPVTLHVVDFTLGAPSLSSVTLNIPTPSPAINIPITASSNFADAIAFNCPNAAANNVTCAFTAISSTSATLTITPTAGVVPPFVLNISANAVSHPAAVAKTATISVTLTANQDYQIAISNTPLTTTVLGNPPAAFGGTLKAFNGYNAAVNLSCVAGTTPPPATCTVSTSPLTPTTGGAAFTVTAADATVNTFNFKIHSTDGTLTHDVPVALTVNADFHMPATAVTCSSVSAGGTSTCSFDIGPDGLSTFASAVTYTCASAGFPNLSTCSFNPASITAGSPATTVTLSIRTTAAVAGLPAGRPRSNQPLYAFWLSLPLMGIVALGSQQARKRGMVMLGTTVLAAALLFSLAACGGGGGGGSQGQPGTNPGAYTFNVNAVSNGITHSAVMKLTVN